MEHNFKVIRTARKSISLSVSPENEITVRCPHNTSERRLNSFLESKKSWLNKVIAKNNAKLSLNSSVLNYKEIYVEGERLPLIISNRNEITENGVYVKNLKHIKSTFISVFSNQFIKIAKILSEQFNLPANGFSVKSYRRRWGCCDSKGKITFNYMLFMLPLQLQRYVIIHELCHTVYFNHSSEFWRLVSKFEPDYKYLRTQLKNYDYITNLY